MLGNLKLVSHVYVSVPHAVVAGTNKVIVIVKWSIISN